MRDMTAPAWRFSALTTSVAIVGLLAIVANFLWGTGYPSINGTESQSAISALKYLKARPFDALALLDYSQRPESKDGAASADRERALVLAAQLAPNDVEVVKALATRAFQRADTVAGLAYVARWASISPAERATALNVLLSAADNREWAGFINALLKTNWPLADTLLLAACSKLGVNQLLELGAAISRSTAIRGSTAACVSAKLIAENRSANARAFWLGTLRPLPSKIGHVFNGDFALPLGDSPFNWTLAEGGEFRDGFRVGRVMGAAPNARSHALVVRFNGRPVHSAVAVQSLALPPGSYRLRYLTKQSGFVGTDSVRWVLRCSPNDSAIEQTMDPVESLANEWRSVGGQFKVADTCSGQSIRLELSSRLQQLSGTLASAVFTDLEVERLKI